MHNAAFKSAGLNAVYLAFETRDLKGALKGMKALNLQGLSVTIPHKTDIIPLLDEVDDLALKIGAVNTVVNRDGRLIGYNTDAQGALKALETETPVAGQNCLIIGAGGAARAIGVILKEKGAKLTIANRSLERGETLARELNCPFSPLDKLDEHTAQILVQTTPVGMYPNVDQSPVPDQTLKSGMIVMDIIYNPRETKLLQAAKENGCTIIDGIGMFVYQGVEQFRLWTGLEPPIEIMTRVVIDHFAKAKSIKVK
jgi:shikimate dehydrogenase